MDVYILDKSFTEIGVIDSYNSLIWTSRYYESGDFELYMPASVSAIDLLKSGKYIAREDSGAVMVIEKINITTDAEEGDYITVSGRSLESILTRRIVLAQTNLNTTLQQAIYTLVDENAINATMGARRFPNLTLQTPALATPEKVQAQITYDNLYDTVAKLCRTYGIGWRITRSGSLLEFGLYRGLDRSENQTVNPQVIFSPEFDNLINSSYNYDAENFKNAALIAGEGEGTARKTWGINRTSAGYDRYELYVDARDISSNNDEIGISEYYNLLEQKGMTVLAEHIATYAFDGAVDTTLQYIYGSDYSLGDIVQVENAYGISATARIVEVIKSWSADGGYTAIPTFEEWRVIE